MKNKVFIVLRLAFVIALLVFLLIRSDAGQILNIFSSVKIPFLAVVFGFIFMDAIVRSFSWGILLRDRNVHLSLLPILHIYWVGSFFGTFLPSSFGTDFARIVLLSRHRSIRAGDSALTILVLNLVNLFALCIIGVFSALVLARLQADRWFVGIVLLFCLAYIVAFPFMVKGGIPFKDQLLNLPRIGKVFNRVQEFAAALGAFRRKEALGVVLLASFASQFLSFLIAYVISLSLNLEIPFFFFALTMPVLTISRIIPLSVAGLGAEQGIFIYLFHQLGVPSNQALLISLLLSAANITFTLGGGLLYVFNNFDSLLREVKSQVKSQ